MSNIDYGFIGWCNEDNHDKIWGYLYRPTPNAHKWATKRDGWNCAKFWAARGKAMQFKADVTGYELDKLVNAKRKKGYVPITEDRLYQIWPTFKEDMEGKLIMELLAGHVK